MDLQIRLGLASTFGFSEPGYRWEIVSLLSGQEVDEIIEKGASDGLMAACADSGAAMQRILIAEKEATART